jgi:hypothetical protein
VYIEKKHTDVFVNTKTSQTIAHLLTQSEKAIHEGKSQAAHELSVQATQMAPESIEAWLLRASLAPSLDERIYCVNQLNELAPGHQDRYDVAFFALKELLDQKPFLAYLEETNQLYRVINADRVVLSIPKKRMPTDPYPPERPTATPLRAANRWLILSIVGLLVAGIGTVLFAPLALLAAMRAYQSVGSHAERVSSTVVVLASVGLFMVGVIFSILFVLHWLG